MQSVARPLPENIGVDTVTAVVMDIDVAGAEEVGPPTIV
jgi:hypothetical protein